MTADVTPLVCQAEAARFTSRRATQEQIAANIAANDRAEALRLIGSGFPGAAQFVMVRSFFTQARALGLHLHQTDAGRTW